MSKSTTADDGTTIGLDLGDKYTEACVLDDSGEVEERFRVRTTSPGLSKRFSGIAPCLVVLEVGTHSPWVSRLLSGLGHQVIVANPRRVRLISSNDSKNDRVDAELLARLGRADPKLLSPITHRGADVQKDLVLLRNRDGFVRARTQLINQARGFAKSLGDRLPSSSSKAFPKRVREAKKEEIFPGLETLLQLIDILNAAIADMDREIERLSRERYPVTTLLRQIKGVGPLTALCFLLTLEDPHRFKNSRSVGAYVGLRPKQRDSGKQQPQLRITKAGDEMLRRYLVNASQYILGPFGPDTDLRRIGLKLAERGGKAAKKRAIVAVARRLAVLLHRLWITGEEYQPLGYGTADVEAA
ncbi:MAG: IS110 family transposase [bacterium]|nr:IS110 family transposase [bacterium]